MMWSKLHLFARGMRDMRMLRYPVERDLQPSGGLYPLDLNPIGERFRPGADGVVRVPGPDGREFFNPVSASIFALASHTRAHRDIIGAAECNAAFLSQARYLRDSQDGEGGWRYPISVRRYGIAPGWYSAMAQGMAISVMLRSLDLTGDQTYLEAADAARHLMMRPLASGGCSDYDEQGRPFLEECPCRHPCHILNGALCALIGLRELEARVGGTAHADAARRLAAQLPQYDLGYWSRYDLRFPAPATLAYHSLHISLLDIAARLFLDRTFSSTAARWRAYARHPGHRFRAASTKARFVIGEGHD